MAVLAESMNPSPVTLMTMTELWLRTLTSSSMKERQHLTIHRQQAAHPFWLLLLLSAALLRKLIKATNSEAKLKDPM